jgi:uncharacterized membrane protein
MSGLVRGSAAAIEERIGVLLAFGTRLGIAFLAVGSLLMVAEGTSPLATSWPPLDLAALPAGLVALEPAAYLWCGLLATLATPLLRVITATAGFARLGERRMVAFGVAVLVVLALAVAAGMTGG